ncbi:hypothetical protein G3545_21965 [Starkeya sp. ORNL1]|uniref:hypothetical protein n=1 Tax=Starkeya sp. ORNL1 TaxID=2709380 RepID=UPI0014647895|nr:hypothetical protein [Starkeya sp. ORNL1]QJP16072.1 hypothetical protein G3545_21965 [Starkeya sp. ORNL1]
MLYLDQPIGTIEGLAIFRDHADDSLFYYASERPRLARNDGVPELVFLVYQRDITDNPNLTPDAKQQLGGGFLAFTVDLSVDQGQLDEVKKKLAAFAGGTVKLAAVPYRKGTVRLSITKDVAEAPGSTEAPGQMFFEEIYGTTKPSLIGDNRATFGVRLDHEGALLMEAALKSGISPIGVIYELEYLGLRPAFNVKITADYKRIYDHLEMQFGVRGGVGPISAAIDIGLAWQELRDNGSVRVEVVNFTDDENFRKQAEAAFDWFKTELLRDFFKSSLEPPAFMKQGQSAGLLGSLQSLLGPLAQGQQGTPAPVRGPPTNLAPTVAPPPTSLDSGVQGTAEQNRAATPSPAAQTPTGTPAAAGAPFGVQVGFTLRKYHQEELKTREFEYSMQAAVAREAAPQGLFSTMSQGLDLGRAIKRVRLDDDFFKRINATVTQVADLAAEKIAAVTVNFEYPGERPPGVPPTTVQGFTFTALANTPRNFVSPLDRNLDLRYRYKVAVDFASDSQWEGNEPHFESGWVLTSSQAPDINPFQALDRLQVDIVATKDLVKAGIEQTQIELDYDDPTAGMRATRTVVLTADQPSFIWRLRFAEGQSKTFRYRITYFLPNNVRYRTDWVASEPITTESASVVVNSPFQGQLALRVIPVLDPLQIIEATVDLVYTDSANGFEQRRQVVFTGGQAFAGQAVNLPTIASSPDGLTATTTIVRMDGSTFIGEPVPVRDRVLVSDGLGETRRIQVELTGTDFNAAGLVAARVRLRGPGETPDEADVIFRPSDFAAKTVALVQPIDGPFRYSYAVEGYTRDGVPRAGAHGESGDLRLFVGLPS